MLDATLASAGTVEAANDATRGLRFGEGRGLARASGFGVGFFHRTALLTQKFDHGPERLATLRG